MLVKACEGFGYVRGIKLFVLFFFQFVFVYAVLKNLTKKKTKKKTKLILTSEVIVFVFVISDFNNPSNGYQHKNLIDLIAPLKVALKLMNVDFELQDHVTI